MAEDKAPVPEAMAVAAADNPLMGMKGMLIRQDTETMECLLQKCLFCRCCEYENVYRMGAIPADKNALTSKGDDAGWTPSQEEINDLPKTVLGKEKSNKLLRMVMACFNIGCIRPFEMDFTPAEGNLSYFRIDRPLTIGGCLCCPHTADTYVAGNKVGRVIEDWNLGNWPMRFVEAMFCCRVPYNVQEIKNGEFVDKYQILFNFCACGPHFNYCGSTFICNDMLFDVKPTAGGEVVGHIQKTYGGCCSPEALARLCCFQADNFIVQWDDNASVEDRALLLTATTLIEYIFFERK